MTRPTNESRRLAIIMGEKTYQGTIHTKCGTTERYVSGSGCVHCARIIATEQREARKRLKAMKAEGAIEDAPVADPAADPFEQSINDIL